MVWVADQKTACGCGSVARESIAQPMAHTCLVFPASDERRRIMAILKLPPNKPLHAEEKELVWRFR